MNEKYWEINGNLDDENDGMKNYHMFENAICRVKRLYDSVFGLEIMNRNYLYVDNATTDSGYVPIITVVLKKYVVIKLGIHQHYEEDVIAYQFAHELTHFVFKAYYGLNKPRASELEETICSAASLIVIKKLYPDKFEIWNSYVRELQVAMYRNGADFAREINYDLDNLKASIIDFEV